MIVVSVIGHGLLLLALAVLVRVPEPPIISAPMVVDLVRLHPPQPNAAQEVAPTSPPPLAVRPPKPSDIQPPAVIAVTPTATPGTGLTEGEIAGAQIAGQGNSPPGGVCDMAMRLQTALRQAPLIRAVAGRLSGKAVRIWDGQWLQTQGEAGNGLAAVRQVIMLEIAFAPPACRFQGMRGLILLSPDPMTDSPRLAIGKDQWTWDDLVTRSR